MKKIVVFFLAAALLLLVFPQRAEAAGSAYMAGPDVVRPGDTITVTFYAGGGIYGGSGNLSYNGLALQGCTSALGGTWALEFSGSRFVFYDNSMASPINGTNAIFTATFHVPNDAVPGTQIMVTAENVVLSDGKTDAGIGSCTYVATIAEPLSGNANLASLTVSNAGIYPAFAAGTTQYSASVPFETYSLQVSAQAEHAGATVTIGNTGLIENGTTDVSVTVTAENGTTKVYHIYVFRARDPNYVESNVNTLADLKVDGFLISPVFDPERADYAVYVPYETENLTLSATVTDTKSTVEVPAVEALTVGESVHEIVVTAENGDTRIYTVTVFRAEPFKDPNAVPEETEPVTEPTTEATTEPTTEPTTVPTTEPATEPTQPAAEDKTSGEYRWLLAIVMVCCAYAGGLLTAPLFNKKKK